MTLVSIVTPSLNQARYLTETIASVDAQTHRPIEHIVVDGGSTDGTVDILAATEGVQWSSEPDRGQSHALNKGFALARGDILGWLNADDTYAADAVEQGVRALAATGAGLVYADVTRVDEDGVNPRRIRSRSTFDLWTELNLGCGVFSPAVFFTRDAYEAVGGIDEELHLTMDYDLWLRIGKRFPIRHVDAVWGTQRLHDAAKTRVSDFWPERLSVSRRHGGRLVSPLLLRRYLPPGPALDVVGRAVSAGYMIIGKRPA